VRVGLSQLPQGPRPLLPRAPAVTAEGLAADKIPNAPDSRWALGRTTSSQRLRWLSSQPPPCGWVNLILLFTADHRPLRDKQHYDSVCRPKVRVPRSSAAIGRAGIALAS